MKAVYVTAWLRAIKAAQTETRDYTAHDDPILDELGFCLEHFKDNVVVGPLYAVVKRVIKSPPQPPLTMPTSEVGRRCIQVGLCAYTGQFYPLDKHGHTPAGGHTPPAS